MDVDLEAFETRWSRSRVRRLLVLPAVVAGVVALAWWAGLLPPAVAVVFLVLSLGLLLLLAVAARASAAHPVALRIDELGLTLPGCPAVPWSDVEVVEVGPLRPAWPIGRPKLVAAVLPRPGVRLGSTPDRGLKGSGWADGLRRRRYGTELVLPLFVLEAEPEVVVGAIETRGRVPVRRLLLHRSRGVWLALLVVGVVLVAVVAVLLLLALLWMVV
ncbi:hypothetical protein SAMN04488544_0519 [Microlunatus sagamiharensis]|uniref:PH domain-containing protein n=1 Tax=Microlunatus sagamiharensis TaxID=546874 RepID=A0A1H2LND0_9ACTN|nr:hypothetical protein [Microlunatus sagamiharensis]SDU82344.1 hypothetical protein SAMN04488544_0519 [Microlunatus sagamiharensis]